jgi:hypothetical protein
VDSKTTPSTPVQDYIATNGEKFPWRDVRLPTSVSPIEYDIYLHPNLTLGKFSGNVTIKCNVKTTTKSIVLHSKDLVVSKVLLKVLPDGKDVKILKQLEYITNEQIYLEVESSLPAGTNISMEITFEGKLIKKLSGFYLSSYEDRNKVTRFVEAVYYIYMYILLIKNLLKWMINYAADWLL